MSWLKQLSIAARDDGQLTWSSNLEAALQSAKARQQEVLIYFRAEGCTECDRFQAEVLSDAYMQTRLRAYTLARVDIRSHPAHAKKYGVANVPALVRLSSDGRYHKTYSGRIDKDGLLAFLRQ